MLSPIRRDSMPDEPKQDDTVLDDEAKALKLAETKAKSRQAIAEAQKATMTAQFPASDLKPIEGKVDVGEKAGMIGELLALSLLKPAVEAIAKGFGPGHRVLVVEGRDLLGSDWCYTLVDQQLKAQTDALNAACNAITVVDGHAPPPPVTPADSGGPDVVE